MRKQAWKDLGFGLEITADGSPTLRNYHNADKPESMHHSGGAFSETIYIYERALKPAFDELASPMILSVGLGLGYNEILSACCALQSGRNLNLISFEKDCSLSECFADWIKGDLPDGEIAQTYEQILKLFENHYDLIDVKNFLKNAVEGTDKNPTSDLNIVHEKISYFDQWSIKGELNLPLPFIKQKVNVFLFDAYSTKANQELWEENFLKEMLQQWTAEQAWFSTYACTGRLRKVLQEQSWQVFKEPGFMGKRDSTFAVKS